MLQNNFDQLLVFNHLLFRHFIQEVNEIWYPWRASINLLRYQILLALCTKCPNNEQRKITVWSKLYDITSWLTIWAHIITSQLEYKAILMLRWMVKGVNQMVNIWNIRLVFQADMPITLTLKGKKKKWKVQTGTHWVIVLSLEKMYPYDCFVVIIKDCSAIVCVWILGLEEVYM